MKMRQLVAFITLIFIFQAAAEEGCESRLGGAAVGLAQILKDAAAKQVISLDDLKRFVAESEWRSPFVGASKGLLIGGFERAFATLEARAKATDRTAVKAIIEKFLIEKGAQKARVEVARQTTAQVLSPMELPPLDNPGVAEVGSRVMVKGKLEGRPIFFERLPGNNLLPGNIKDKLMFGVLYDPLNPDAKKRVTAMQFTMSERWIKEEPFLVQYKNRNLLVYAESKLVFDLNQGKAVSEEFTAGELQGMKLAVETNARQAAKRGAGPIEWQMADDAKAIVFSGAGNPKVTVKLPDDAQIAEQIQPVVLYEGLIDSFALVEYIKKTTAHHTVITKKYVVVVNLRTGKKSKPREFDHHGLGLTLKAGKPCPYNMERLDSGYMGLKMLDLESGTVETVETRASALHISDFFFRGSEYLIWTDERGLVVRDVDSGAQIVTPTEYLGVGSFTFSYHGDWYFFMPDNLARVFRLTGVPQ